MVKVSLTISLPYSTYEKLRQLAESKFISNNRMASDILENNLSKKKTQTITKKKVGKK